MWYARTEDGYLFGEMPKHAVETLRAIPMLVESSDERVRSRLLPETYEEPEEEAGWREHAMPELERLFLSRAHLVQRDLDAIQRMEDGSDSWMLHISNQHVNAWLSSLNAARLALYVLNDMTEAHMARGGLAKASPKQQEAILRIHFMAELQGVLMGDDYDLDEDPGAGGAEQEP